MTYSDTEEFWSKRAEEARTIAERMSNRETSRLMLGAAQDYERLARLAKERAAIMARLGLFEELDKAPQD